MCTVVLLDSRSQVPDMIEKYINWAENKTGHRVKSFMSDNALEYMSGRVKEFFMRKGIEQVLIPSYSPQTNGIAERKNQTLCTIARCLLADAGFDNELKTKLWGRAIVHANFISNRVPLKSGKIPWECFTSEQADYSYLKRFGSLSYVIVNKSSKLEDRAKKMILVGQASKGYLLFDPVQLTVHLERNVKVLEDKNFLEGKNGDVEIFEPMTRTHESYVNRISHTSVVPTTYSEALCTNCSEDWEEAVTEEFNNLVMSKTFVEIDESDERIIDTKWIFQEKYDENGLVVRRKARLVAKGYQQHQGLDFDDVYAPVCEKSSLRVLLTLAASRNYNVYHIDVKHAFLHGRIDEPIYVRPPDPLRKVGKIWRLERALYGLKQSPKIWYKHLLKLLTDAGFRSTHDDPCLFTNGDISLAIYVDDILIAGRNRSDADVVKQILNSVEIHDLGQVKTFLGVNVAKLGKYFVIDQSNYIKKLSELYDVKLSSRAKKPLADASSVYSKDGDHVDLSLPLRDLVGSLLYVANWTRPDVAAAVSILSRSVSKPTQTLWRCGIQILKYLLNTSDCGLALGVHNDTSLEAYVDADHGSDPNTRKSQSGILITLFGSSVQWSSKKQATVSLSSGEAEYVAMACGASCLLGMKKIVNFLGNSTSYPLAVYEDNRSSIQMLTGSTTRVKHLDIKYHFVKDLQFQGVIDVRKVSSDDQLADVLTKPSPKKSFNRIRIDLGLIDRGEVLEYRNDSCDQPNHKTARKVSC